LPPEVLAAAALMQFQAPTADSQGAPPSSDPYNPWRASSGFRMGEK